MPSYLDFNSTEEFRNNLINKTLKHPEGPQSFTSDRYLVSDMRELPNTQEGDVESARDLGKIKNSNIFTPEQYFIVENINTIPKRDNLGLYPYFTSGNYGNFIGILSTTDYESESQLMKFAAWNIQKNPDGPLFSRIQQNLYSSTIGRVRLVDALDGSLSTALNIVRGREPIIESNPSITTLSGGIGKTIDFLATVSGVEFPWATIPGDYLSNPKNPILNRPEARTELGRTLQDTTGAIGSMFGIERRPTTTRKPSDLFIEYTGQRQKSFLFDNLSYSKYAPDYTTTARSQNTSKLFNLVDRVGEGIKDVLGLEAPKGTSYIGDDRGDDVKYAMGDFNDRPVRSSYYLSLMFDTAQSQIFGNQKNIIDGGSIAGNLTWISSKSKNKLGEGNNEYNTERSQFESTLSRGVTFRKDSILGVTQDILETMPTDGGAARSHVANVIDQTSRIFREGDKLLSRGSAIKYVDKFRGFESGVEYCRVWTKDRSYLNNSDTMKRTTNIRKFESSVLSKPWNLNIYPNSNGKKEFGSSSTNMVRGEDGGFYAKKYMFSIENLAWKNSNTPGFTFDSLPYCERGSNGGRVMWFPPYDLKVSEQNNASWETNRFLGRPEPVYTYSHTERRGQVSFKVIVDHPSILNLLVREHFGGMSDEEADNYINAFFAGCEEVDFYGLIRKYTTLTQDEVVAIKNYLNQNKDENVVLNNKKILEPLTPDEPAPLNEPVTQSIEAILFFDNDVPTSTSRSLPDALYSDVNTSNYGLLNEQYVSTKEKYKETLQSGLTNLKNRTWDRDSINDYRVLFQQELSEKPDNTTFDDNITKSLDDIDKGFLRLESEYTKYSTGLNTITQKLEKNQIQNISVIVSSQTSSIGDDVSNLRLSYRRSHSVLIDIIKRISKDGFRSGVIDNFKWNDNIDENTISSTQPEIKINLKDFGYESDGEFVVEYVENIGEQPIGSEETTGSINVDCTEAYRILTSSDLKKTAPRTFYCRNALVEIRYTEQPVDTKPEESSVVERRIIEVSDDQGSGKLSPPIDEMKKIIMKTLSECYYFKMLEEESPVQFSSLREKLKYFHPAFHSMTPEGLNARLTFLQQCVRPGDTLPIKGISDFSDLNARNTTFGPPPICVLRVGDFFNSKVIINDVNITYDDSIWDLNPEGIGVQPMIANVSLQVSFIGGHGLEKPVEKLQNALSSNFYANTEMYDPRSISTEDRSKFYEKVFDKEFLERVNQRNVDNTIPPDDITDDDLQRGEYIGEVRDNKLNYTSLINEVFNQTENYFNSFIDNYNEVVGSYDTKISSIILDPTYRSIDDYTIQNGVSTVSIDMLGNYPRSQDLTVIKTNFKSTLLSKVDEVNVSQLFGFDKEMGNPILVKSEEILKPRIKEFIIEEVDGIRNDLMKGVENVRNELILTLDRLNFIIETSGHDGKILGDTISGSTFIGYTYDQIYDEYSNVVNYFTTNHNKLTEDIDTTYSFFSTSMSDDEFSYFISVLLRTKINDIVSLYDGDTIFTDRIKKGIRKRLDSFMKPQPNRKRFNLPKYPKRKNNNEVEFEIVNEDHVFTNDEQTKLRDTLRISGNIYTTTLNYYRR